MLNDSKINEIAESTGYEYSEREKAYALHRATGKNKSEAARLAGYAESHARQQGYNLSQDPKIIEMVDALQQYQSSLVTEDLIQGGLLKEALTADNSRDRKGAWDSLAKTKGMFKDVSEVTHQDKTDIDLLQKIEDQFGKEARKEAEFKLGYH